MIVYITCRATWCIESVELYTSYYIGITELRHIFLESPHQVDMKNIAKCYKHFFGYFNALKTHGALFGFMTKVIDLSFIKGLTFFGLICIGSFNS